MHLTQQGTCARWNLRLQMVEEMGGLNECISSSLLACKHPLWGYVCCLAIEIALLAALSLMCAMADGLVAVGLVGGWRLHR